MKKLIIILIIIPLYITNIQGFDYRIEQKMALIKNILNNPEHADSIFKCSEFYIEGFSKIESIGKDKDFFKYFNKMNFCLYRTDELILNAYQIKFSNNKRFLDYLLVYHDSSAHKKGRNDTCYRIINDSFIIYPDYSDTTLNWDDKIKIKFVYLDKINKWSIYTIRNICENNYTIISSSLSNLEKLRKKLIDTETYPDSDLILSRQVKNSNYSIVPLEANSKLQFLDKYKFIFDIINSKKDVLEQIKNSEYYNEAITKLDSSFTLFKSFAEDKSNLKIIDYNCPFAIDDYRFCECNFKIPNEDYWKVRYLDIPTIENNNQLIKKNEYFIKFIYINNKWILEYISEKRPNIIFDYQ